MSNVKISALTQGSPLDSDICVYVDLENNQTKKCLKSELKGEQGPQGETGATGATGPEGPTGATGADGASAFVYIAYASDASGTGFTMTFNASLDYVAIKSTTTAISSPSASDFTGLWKNYKGATGATGSAGTNGTNGTNGTDGRGITSVTLYSTVGKVKTYRMLFTDATTFDYTVTDGADGTGSGDMLKSTYDPTNKNADAFSMDNMAQGSTNKFISSAQLTVLGNTSGTNTGDNATNSQYSGLATSKADINSPSFTGTPSLPTGTTGVTQSAGDNSTKLATTAYTDSKDSATLTLTNKRINPRLVTAASYTTDTGTSLSVATCDQFEITAQAGALKFNNPGGTPLGGQQLMIRIKDNGTARALTYDTQFRASSDLALPTTTIVSKTLYMKFVYNATDTKWDLLAYLNNF